MSKRDQADIEQCWDALYPEQRRKPAAGTRQMLGALAGLSVLLGGGAALSQAMWGIKLTTFSANTPALASEVNNNFSQVKTAVEQLKTWQDAKLGAADSPNVITKGQIQQDIAATTYDVWIQGSSATAAGDARNLALLGVAQGQGDRLILNYNGEYANGTEVHGPRLSVMYDLDVANDSLVQGDATVRGTLAVTGEITSANRYLVSTPFSERFSAANTTSSTATIDMTRLNALCGDDDGCTIRVIMDRFNNLGESASLGPVHFGYNTTNGRFRLADGVAYAGGEQGATIGTDGDNALQHALRAWNCFFTDSAYSAGSGSAAADSVRQMYLLNYNANTSYKGACVLVIDD